MNVLSNYVNTLKGFAFKSSWYTSDGTGVPIIKASNFGSETVTMGEFEKLSLTVAGKFDKYKVDQNDVVIQTVGSWPNNPQSVVGKVIRCQEDVAGFLLNQNIVKLIPKETTDKKYLYYLLKNSDFKNYITARARGAANQASITLKDILNYEVVLPDVEEQLQRSSILSAYDELIENNGKRISILEDMAQRLFAEWFVKFRFPGYERVKMIDSHLGKIPNEWKVKNLSEIANVIRGTSYSSEEISDVEGDLYLVNLKSFNRGGGFRFDGAKYFNGVVKDEQILNQGNIVVAVTDMTTDRAIISRPARIPNLNYSKITFSADVVKVVPEAISSVFTYYSLMDYRFTETTKNKANGANVLHLRPQAISDYKILIPTHELMMKFENICLSMANLSDILAEENQRLIESRDLLIPQLVTGRRKLKV